MFKIGFSLWGGVGFTLISYGDYFFFMEFLKIFLFVLWWNFINICLTLTHSFTQFFLCTTM